MRPPQTSTGADDGFATVTAIILCAAISILCVGILTDVMTQKRQAERQLFQLQQSEAINTAVMGFSTELIRAQGDTTLSETTTIRWPGGQTNVKLRAEYEGRKWPASKIGEVDERVLATYTRLSKDELASMLSAQKTPDHMPENDCLRSIISIYGNANPNKELPKGVGVISVAAGHDGQVWLIRSEAGRVVEERYVRFTGDSAHLFAIISQETFPAFQLPNCQEMTVVP